MSSDTTPSASTEPITPDTTTTPNTAPRSLTGGCMCKSIRYKIARDECQERMNMSMSPLHDDRTLTIDVIVEHVNNSLPLHLVLVS